MGIQYLNGPDAYLNGTQISKIQTVKQNMNKKSFSIDYSFKYHLLLR